jgi:signal transduction histidine kinase/ActR/RegA family two-component response regulator
MYRDLFGARVRHLRLERNLTIAALADRVDVTMEHLGNVERGVSAPSFGLICSLARALETDPQELFRFSSPSRESALLDAAALERALREAREETRAKSELLATVSHDIRTPLNGIMGMLQLLEMSPLDPGQAQCVQDALHASKRLNRMLGDLLDLSRVEAGRLELRNEPFDPFELMERLGDMFRPTARQAALALNCRAAPSLPSRLVGDPLRVQQILDNLVANAFKFTTTGGVFVEARPLPLARSGRCRVLFSVSDTGLGIMDDQLPRLFEPYTQQAGAGSARRPGVGLGLCICKRLVQLMDGSLVVDSRWGRGTDVYVSLPFGLPAGKERSRAKAEPSGTEAALGNPGLKLKVLLAEDDSHGSLFLKRLLERRGCTVRLAWNGEQAVQALRDECFDVVLMDLQMPGLDGLSAARAVRSGAAGAHASRVPMLAVTAHAMPGDRERCLAAGMDGHLAKPVEWKALAQELFRVLPHGSRDS